MPSRGKAMTADARNAMIRARQNNINRYCRLLATNLTNHEREYIHRRIVEERAELENLLKFSTSPDETSKPPGGASQPNEGARTFVPLGDLP
jgi:hypothetical protein